MTHRAPSAARRTAGFTLVELMTVVVIIALLLTILVPTVAGIVKLGYATKCRGVLKTLETGAMAYFVDTGNRFYPGQTRMGEIAGEGGSRTGSQMLALCLLSDRTGTRPFTEGATYMEYAEGLLIDPATNIAFSDTFSDPLAICYYVSRPNQTGMNQYSEAHNTMHTNDPNKGGDFGTFIRNPGASGVTPYKDGQFLLIAPGIDRKYFTDDDITNFTKK